MIDFSKKKKKKIIKDEPKTCSVGSYSDGLIDCSYDPDPINAETSRRCAKDFWDMYINMDETIFAFQTAEDRRLIQFMVIRNNEDDICTYTYSILTSESFVVVKGVSRSYIMTTFIERLENYAVDKSVLVKLTEVL